MCGSSRDSAHVMLLRIWGTAYNPERGETQRDASASCVALWDGL